MCDKTTPQDSAAMPPASTGSVDALSVLRKLRDGVRGMGIGDPDCGERVEASDIVRWAVDEIEQLRGSMEWYKDLLREAEEKMCRMALTDAEREAVDRASETLRYLQADYGKTQTEQDAYTLRALLERTKGGGE